MPESNSAKDGKPKVIRTCAQCGSSFIAKRPEAKFCSGKCRHQNWFHRTYQKDKTREERLIIIGKQMANACFNLSQQNELSEAARKTLRELQQEWDKALESIDLRNLNFIKQ